MGRDISVGMNVLNLLQPHVGCTSRPLEVAELQHRRHLGPARAMLHRRSSILKALCARIENWGVVFQAQLRTELCKYRIRHP